MVTKRNDRRAKTRRRKRKSADIPARPGPAVELADDGLPVAEGPLSPDHLIVRRVIVEHFDRKFERFGAAIGKSRGTARKLALGLSKVSRHHMEAMAKAIGTTVEGLRMPHPQAIMAQGKWFYPDHPDYKKIARNFVAATDDVDPAGFAL